ncbi:MAG: hypothetical protein JXA96_06960 [Sedimentisphaerales bacterium]|nr:hypothetical protein [Sedimentisphaerales bacterium]
MDSEKEIALFYPHPFNVQNIKSLKTLALYWDEIRFITSTEEKRFYRNCLPIEEEYISVGLLKPYNINEFSHLIEKAGQELLDDISENPVIIDDIINQANQNEKTIDIEIIPLSIDKINLYHQQEINKHLFKRKISLVPIDQTNVAIPAKLFELYISRLASFITQKDGLIPLTDQLNCQNAVLSRFIDYSGERKKNQADLAKLSLQIISINPNVPLDDILKFREKNRNELAKYRKHIKNIARGISQGLETSEKQKLIEEIVKYDFIPLKQEIQSKLSESDIAFGLSAFDILQAIVIGTIATGGSNWKIGITGSGISLIVSLYKSLREDRNIIRDHPLGYLYQAQKQFGATTK